MDRMIPGLTRSSQASSNSSANDPSPRASGSPSSSQRTINNKTTHDYKSRPNRSVSHPLPAPAPSHIPPPPTNGIAAPPPSPERDPKSNSDENENETDDGEEDDYDEYEDELVMTNRRPLSPPSTPAFGASDDRSETPSPIIPPLKHVYNPTKLWDKTPPSPKLFTGINSHANSSSPSLSSDDPDDAHYSLTPALYHLTTQILTLLTLFTTTVSFLTILTLLYTLVYPFSSSLYRRLACTFGLATYVDALSLSLPNVQIKFTQDSKYPSTTSPHNIILFRINEFSDMYECMMVLKVLGLSSNSKWCLEERVKGFWGIGLCLEFMDFLFYSPNTGDDSATATDNSFQMRLASFGLRSNQAPCNNDHILQNPTNFICFPSTSKPLTLERIEALNVKIKDQTQNQAHDESGAAPKSPSKLSPIKTERVSETISSNSSSSNSNNNNSSKERPILPNILLPDHASGCGGFLQVLGAVRQKEIESNTFTTVNSGVGSVETNVYVVSCVNKFYDGRVKSFVELGGNQKDEDYNSNSSSSSSSSEDEDGCDNNLALKSLWRLIRGQKASEVQVRITRHSLAEVCGGENMNKTNDAPKNRVMSQNSKNKAKEWLDDIWKFKSVELDYFARNGCFPSSVSSSSSTSNLTSSQSHTPYVNAKLSQSLSSKYSSLETSILSLFRLVSVFFALPFLVLLSVPLGWCVFWCWVWWSVVVRHVVGEDVVKRLTTIGKGRSGSNIGQGGVMQMKANSVLGSSGRSGSYSGSSSGNGTGFRQKQRNAVNERMSPKANNGHLSSPQNQIQNSTSKSPPPPNQSNKYSSSSLSSQPNSAGFGGDREDHQSSSTGGSGNVSGNTTPYFPGTPFASPRELRFLMQQSGQSGNSSSSSSNNNSHSNSNNSGNGSSVSNGVGNNSSSGGGGEDNNAAVQRPITPGMEDEMLRTQVGGYGKGMVYGLGVLAEQVRGREKRRKGGRKERGGGSEGES